MENQITQVPIIVVLTQSFSKKKAQEMRQVLLNENLDIIQITPDVYKRQPMWSVESVAVQRNI